MSAFPPPPGGGGLRGVLMKFTASQYVSEAVSALAEANLKPKDISAALQVASLLHQRYADFGGALADALSNSLLAACTDTSGPPPPPPHTAPHCTASHRTKRQAPFYLNANVHHNSERFAELSTV